MVCVCVCVCVFIHQSVCLSACLYACVSACVSVYPSVRLYVCLSVCLFFLCQALPIRGANIHQLYLKNSEQFFLIYLRHFDQESADWSRISFANNQSSGLQQTSPARLTVVNKAPFLHDIVCRNWRENNSESFARFGKTSTNTQISAYEANRVRLFTNDCLE